MSHPVTSTTTPEIRGFRVSLPSVFDFDDYRAYLREVIQVRQRNDESYTIGKLARALGFSSHSGLIMILNGKRELQPPYLDRCIRNLELQGKARLYFESLVRAGGRSPKERKALLRELEFHTASWSPPDTKEGFRLLDFFIVQQILSLHRDYLPVERIMAQFRYAVRRQEVEAVLDWMLEREYVEKSPQGYRVQRSVLMVQDEVPNASGRQMHRDCLELAKAALDEDPLERREFQSYVMTMDSKRVGEMKQKIKKIVLETISEFETELDGDTVMQVHFNLFEVSRRLGSGPVLRTGEK